MKKCAWVVLVLFVATVALAQAQAPPAQSKTTAKAGTDLAAVKKAIEDADAAFLAALQKGDANAAVAGYANDAVVMMPGEPAWKGHAAILKGLQAFLNGMTVTNGTVRTSDVMLGGNYAIETGTFEWTLAPKNGKPVTDKGKYLTVWKHEPDGTWKIVRDINNSDLPAK